MPVTTNPTTNPEWTADLGRAIRLFRAGGTVLLSDTGWWGPHGGHETALWHYLGGQRRR